MDRTEEGIATYRAWLDGADKLLEMARQPVYLVRGDGGVIRANTVARQRFDEVSRLPVESAPAASLSDACARAAAGSDVLLPVEAAGRSYDLQLGPATPGLAWAWLHPRPARSASDAVSSLFQSSNIFALMLAADGRILRANPVVERISGYSTDELEGRYPWETLFTSEAEQVREHLAQSLASGHSEHRVSLTTRKRERRLLACSTAVVPDVAGTELILATAVDVTDWCQAEAQLAEAEQRYHSLVKAVFPLEVVQCDNRIVHINESGAAMLGADSPASLIGKPLTELFPPEEHATVLSRVRLAIERWQPLPPAERRVQRRDGSLLDMEVTAIPILFEGRPATHAVFQDVSRRKRNEQELARYGERLEELVTQRTAELLAANREIEAFSHSVSHDLRAPLRAINGFASALVEDYGDRCDGEPREYLERIRANSTRMGLLIEQLMSLSKIVRKELHWGRVDIGELARSVVEDLQAADPARNVSVQIDDDLMVWGDATMLRIALQNLIGNAWKYTARRDQACIEVRRGAGNGTAGFRVKDNGVGFDQAYAGELFNAFHRLHGASEFEGSGIGLTTVKRIVVRHGGTVWAEGEEGVGATFHVNLPEPTGNFNATHKEL